jgi:hypothetical protein
MADEIISKLRINLINGLLKLDFNPATITIDQATGVLFDSVRSIATTETSVALTGITTPKVAIIWNLDATNFCELGTTSTDYPIKLFPTTTGLPNILTLNATKTTLYLKANTAATRVRIIVLEA